MVIGDWKYYNHGWISTIEPKIEPELTPLNSGELFSHGGVLARYTTQYDCAEQTDWWYTVKDTPFNISELSSKRRWTVKKGEKEFDVKRIDPTEFTDEIYQAAVSAFSVYPKKYRPKLQKDNFTREISGWKTDGYITYGAFARTDNFLAAYCVIGRTGNCINLLMLKSVPEYEKLQVNAALIYKLLQDCNSEIAHGGLYISNGERNILHQTNFNDYLEKYFGFRKVYAKLHVVYAPKYRTLVKLLYPFRKMFKMLDRVGKVHQLNGVLKMEEIVRKQNKTERLKSSQT